MAQCVKDKKVETCLANSGFEHPSQIQRIKEQKFKTMMDIQVPELMVKKNATIKDKYCVEQCEIVQEKTKRIMMNRYGVEYTFQSTEFNTKREQTMMVRYKTVHALQASECLEKKKQTSMIIYGVPYACMAQSVKDKLKQTVIMLPMYLMLLNLWRNSNIIV